GHVPPARLAARPVDLDRRADRVLRRADRHLAAAAHRWQPRPRRLRRTRGTGGAHDGPGLASGPMEFLLVLIVLAVVVLVVTSPLRPGHAAAAEAAQAAERDELEAERDAKYREIRD